MTDQQLVSGAFSALNRLVHIERDSVANDNYIYMGAAKYIMSIAPNIYKSDFAVVDIIVTPEVLTSLASVLLKSTFYYDVTNGISYVSHYDDGLVHPSFGKLAQVSSSELLFCF